jgi:Flp pilus assembly protein TadD
MNRHERRKQKKERGNVSALQNELLKAIQFHVNKDFNNAELLYQQIISKEPDNYDALRHLGILKQDIGNYEEAYNHYLKCIKLRPNGFEALNNLGAIHVRNKNYPFAQKCFEKANAINQNYVPVINNLASLFHKLQNKESALKFSTRALSLQPDNPITKNQHAKALILNSKLEEAIQILEQCYSENPNDSDTALNLSTAYKENGNFEKANKIIGQLFIKDFKNITNLVAYTGDKNNSLKNEHIEYYKDLLKQDQLLTDDKVLIHHAFFNNFKNQKKYIEAGKYLVDGNSLQYRIKPFDIENEKLIFEKIKSLFLQKRELNIGEEETKLIPIFVCGMPRSGTTLCEQILSSHSNIDGAGELNYLTEVSGLGNIITPDQKGLENFENVISSKKIALKARREYLKSLSSLNTNNVKYICDKMPHNFVLIGLIRLILPESKIIYCKRDPIDNCFSLYSHKFTELSHQYSYDQKTLAQYYKLHTSLMDVWIKNYKNSIFVLDNEELVNNQEKISKQLIDFCELEWEDQCLEFHKSKRQVRTASIEQVRQPINKKSIGAWKKYEKFFAELVTELNK